VLTKPPSLRTPAEQAVIQKGLQALLAAQNEDGSFGDDYVNYTTCATVMCLDMAGKQKFGPQLAKAQRYLLAMQHAEDMGYHRSDRDYGSFGYGSSERGDLSNTQMTLEALRSTGLASDHEAFRKALQFLARVQNHKTTNDFKTEVKDPDTGEWHKVAAGDDGGATYYPGNSPAGYDQLADGTKLPRSYGSMTYALLKAYVLCGLPADDPRMQAAKKWINDHFTVEVNPGASPKLGDKAQYQGLFYYYLTMARALSLMGVDHLPGKDDQGIDWRGELSKALQKLQHPDGSWLNDKNERWWENSPILCTAYALLALDGIAQRP
jgi:squalene-hopene/tetraprenyl-beta-curcumene cyclase